MIIKKLSGLEGVSITVGQEIASVLNSSVPVDVGMNKEQEKLLIRFSANMGVGRSFLDVSHHPLSCRLEASLSSIGKPGRLNSSRYK